MIKHSLSIIFFVTTVAFSAPWMPWDSAKNDNNSNFVQPWMPWNANTSHNTNWMPFDLGSNWTPFNSRSNLKPKATNNWGPLNSALNWGPMSTVGNWVNDTNFNIYFKTNNKAKTTGIANTNAKYTGALHNQLFGKNEGYANAQADAYYEGLANYYNKIKNQNSYYGYKSSRSFDYMPKMDNSFPAPVINLK